MGWLVAHCVALMQPLEGEDLVAVHAHYAQPILRSQAQSARRSAFNYQTTLRVYPTVYALDRPVEQMGDE